MKTPDYIMKSNLEMGEFLFKEFLLKYEFGQKFLAHQLRVSPNRINEIVLGKRAISVDTDLRLCKFFGLESGFFIKKLLDLQLKYAKTELRDKIREINQSVKVVK